MTNPLEPGLRLSTADFEKLAHALDRDEQHELLSRLIQQRAATDTTPPEEGDVQRRCWNLYVHPDGNGQCRLFNGHDGDHDFRAALAATEGRAIRGHTANCVTAHAGCDCDCHALAATEAAPERTYTQAQLATDVIDPERLARALESLPWLFGDVAQTRIPTLAKGNAEAIARAYRDERP